LSAIVITSSGGGGSFTAEYLSSPPTLSNTQTTPILCDDVGNLLVTVNALGIVGQKAMAASLPVVLASNQSAIPVNLQDGAGNSITEGQKNMNGSLPVVLASNQSAIPVNLQTGSGSAINFGSALSAASLPVVIASDQTVPVSGTVTAQQTYVSVKNEMDTSLLNTASTNINGSGGAFVQVVASLGNACKKIRIADTTGGAIGVYTGGSGSEVFAFMTNPGIDDYIEHAIAANTRVSLRSMQVAAITSGLYIMQFSA
jgi:hypothetical protein